MALSEFELIKRIKACQPLLPEGVEGIGDDAAVIPVSKSGCIVVTADALVEDVHFRRSWATAYQTGRKSAAVNLSDIAAMGAEPMGMFLSVSLPGNLPEGWPDEFIEGVGSWNVPLMGGDTTSSPDRVYINITAFGTVSRDTIKRRSTARPGNALFVTGNLGDSAAGLYVLEHGIEGYESLVKAHLDPHPRLAEGRILARTEWITAMMDISDGLAGDASHIAEQSNLSVRIDCSSLPMSAQMLALCESYSLDPLHFALSGGEDYELLFATEEKNSLPLHAVKVGSLYAGHDGTVLENAPEGKSYKGYTHF